MHESLRWEEEIRKRLQPLRLTPAREAGIVEELAEHLEEDYRKLLAAGATETEAYAIALEGLTDKMSLTGERWSVEQPIRQDATVLDVPERKGIMADLWQDLRHALGTRHPRRH